jgi:hypothetical protein
MNSTERKILTRFNTALETNTILEAARITCNEIREQATEKWGKNTGDLAFLSAAELIKTKIEEFEKAQRTELWNEKVAAVKSTYLTGK